MWHILCSSSETVNFKCGVEDICFETGNLRTRATVRRCERNVSQIQKESIGMSLQKIGGKCSLPLILKHSTICPETN